MSLKAKYKQGYIFVFILPIEINLKDVKAYLAKGKKRLLYVCFN